MHKKYKYVKLFIMLNNKNTIVKYLRHLNLTADEATIYTELLKEPASHLELARATGINRTKVYRIVDQLEKRSLATMQTDDSGTFVYAADPATLEVELVNQEEKLKNQRAVFNHVLPDLENIRKTGANSPDNFVVNTYDGVEGFKQMLWHELKTKDEVVIFGSGVMEKLVPNRRWTEKHRAKTVEAGYKVREIINPGKKESDFTDNKEFVEKVFSKRLIPDDVLFLEHQVVIYNDTVATYCWRGDQKVGFEVVNKAYNQMMRQMFEHYWKLAK